MAIYNSKNNTWETRPITEWNELKISFGRFLSYDINSFKVKHLQLTNFKEDFKDFVNFKSLNLLSLDLSYNNIKDLDIAYPLTLQELNLSFNNLMSFNSSIVEHLPNLEKLDLSNNFITQLEPFKSKSIKWLILSSNPLQNINKDIFQELDDKCTVFLFNCRIKNDVEKSLVHPYIKINVDMPRDTFTEEDKNKAWTVFTESLKNKVNPSIEVEQLRKQGEKDTEKYILKN